MKERLYLSIVANPPMSQASTSSNTTEPSRARTPVKVGRPPKYVTEEEKRQAVLENGRRFREKNREAQKTVKDLTKMLSEPGKEWFFVLKTIGLACKMEFEESNENFKLLYDTVSQLKRK